MYFGPSEIFCTSHALNGRLPQTNFGSREILAIKYSNPLIVRKLHPYITT